MTYFRNWSRWIHSSQKRTSIRLLWRHSSKTWTSSQQKDLGFSRLGSRLLQWLWAYHMQLSAQIFYPDCRLFCLFQDFSPLKKVLHPEHSPCKPHAVNNLIQITLFSQETIQVGSNETNNFRKPQQGRRKQQYVLSLLTVTKQSGNVRRTFKEAYFCNTGQSGQATSIPWIFQLYWRAKSLNNLLSCCHLFDFDSSHSYVAFYVLTV